MKTLFEPKQDFPIRLSPRGRPVAVRSLAAGDRERMVSFARALPENDLLFLQRDITQPAEVEAWLKDEQEGRLTTLVACEGGTIVGYSTFERGSARWTRHVAELRVVVARHARGIGVGRLLLESAFERVLAVGVTKIIARMTPDQSGALSLFKWLGFTEEAVLRDHAVDAGGLAHDLLVLSFHTRLHQKHRCAHCGTPVLDALSIAGSRLCSLCYEIRYQELGGGG